MLTVADLRAAVTSAAPAAALEGLARQEFAAGRTREQVSDAIADLLPELRTLPDYADEWEDSIAGVVDRLTGWTHPAAQLHPPAGNGSSERPHGTGVSEGRG